MYEWLDNAWTSGEVSEWLGYYVKVWIIAWASEYLSEGMCGRLSQWVSDEMREQSSERADVWNYESEWENEVWINEWTPKSIREWICELSDWMIDWVELSCV